MKKIVLLAISGAALVVSVSAVSAQYYYREGPSVYFGQRYERDYDEPRYRHRYRREERRERYGYEGRRYNTWNGCPHMYTVQGGECKPYIGR
jgi:hypothetical protein